jgi:hypothetical protein
VVLLDETPPQVADTVTARLFASWSEGSRRQWLRAHFTTYPRCALTPYHFRYL